MSSLANDKIPRLMTGPSYRVDISMLQLGKVIADFVEEGLDLDPDFQRGHVWSEIQRVRWIEFLVKGGKPYSSILLNHPGWNTLMSKGDFVLVDGKQRLTAILDFVENKIPIFAGLEGKKEGWIAYEISEAWLGRIFINLAINDLQTRPEVLRWYLELNEGAVAHTDAELKRVHGLLDACK